MAEVSSRIPVRFILEGVGEAEGVLTKISAPLTVEAILRALPLEGRAYPCPGGIYFIIGLRRGEEKSRRRVEAGTIAYWPMSDSICVFHSASTPYSPVNIIGRITKNLESFKLLRSGTKVRMEKL
ncbi:hypothetical protein CW700_00405 [Candidatus Bathyarchaeota archaeon]|nr:MAG: hypothetical protein CW700_00405 [Candidatus Bathyarchaeota archaeon]